MNTADRSLALIDTALRRRFEFKDLYPDTRETKVDNDPFSAPLAGLMVDSIDVRRMLECINERIEVLYDRDHCIGHAYFTGLINKGESTDTGNKFDHFRHIFFNRIKPLLEEYFFDDWEKIGRVLGDHLKKESRLQFLKKLPLPKDLRDFEDNSDDSQIFLRPRYRWNDNAFSDPEAYIGIYSPS
jgi:5-methylcytosine-specific restriction protein B